MLEITIMWLNLHRQKNTPEVYLEALGREEDLNQNIVIKSTAWQVSGDLQTRTLLGAQWRWAAEPVGLGSEKGWREGRESEIVQRHLPKIPFIF